MVEMPTHLAARRRPPPPPPVPGPPSRKVGFLLGVGILLMPLVFVWLLLRRGYSTFARLMGFGWLVALTILIATAPEGVESPAAPSVNPTQPVAPAAPPPPESDAEKVKRFAADYLQLAPVGGVLSGSGATFSLSAELTNTSAFDIKDPMISCFVYGTDGQVAATGKVFLPGAVPAGGGKRLKAYRVRLDRQVAMTRYHCSIVEAEAVTP
jgi:hypothetical protein